MQRWIVGGLVAVMILFGGLLGFYKLVYQPNRPAPIWVPLPIRVDLETSKRDEIIAKLKKDLSEDEILTAVSKDLGLMRQWNLSSDKEAAAEIRSRLFVRAGDAATPMGRVPAIHIGLTGKAKERELSGKIAMRIMDDVWKILGIDPPAKKDP